MPVVAAGYLTIGWMLSGCSNKSDVTTAPQTKIMLINASVTAPDSIDFLSYNGFKLETISANHSYLKTSGYLDASAGVYVLLADTANQSDAAYLVNQRISIDGGKSYSFFVYDSSNYITNTFLTTDEPLSGNNDSARIRFLHLSPSAPDVDISVNNHLVFSKRRFHDMDSNNLLFTEVPADSISSITVFNASTGDVLSSISAASLRADSYYSLLLTGLADRKDNKKITLSVIEQR